jgi:hypothetical protein
MVAPFPAIAYRFDNQAWTRTVVGTSVTLTLPTATSAYVKRALEIVVIATSQSQNRWHSPPVAGVYFTGLTVTASAGTLIAPQTKPRNIICIGDSITEGVNTLGGNIDVTTSDGSLGWAYNLGAQLGVEVGVVGFGNQGFQQLGNGNVPFVQNSYNLIAAGITRTFSPAPDVIVINEGTNDGVVNVQTQMTTLLNGLITACPTSEIIVLRPFNGTSQAANWIAAVAACSAPSQVVYIDTNGWISSADTQGGLHPYGAVNIDVLAPQVANAIKPYLPQQRRFVNVSGVASALLLK